MIRSVVFDLGKVLVDFDYGIAVRRIAARTDMSALKLGLSAFTSPLMIGYETGELTTQQFYEGVRAATGYRGGPEEFGESFGDIFWEIKPMIQLHAALRQRGFPTYVFSNTNELAITSVRRNFPFYAGFDGYVLSYEQKVMKPDARLYEVIEAKSGHRGAEVLYLDDRAENIAAGAERGWQVILHESPEKTRAAIEKLGLLNSSSALSDHQHQ